MKKYSVFILVAMLHLVGCSQKEEKIEKIKEEEGRTPITLKGRPPLPKLLATDQTLSDDYVKAIEKELRKSREDKVVASVVTMATTTPSSLPLLSPTSHSQQIINISESESEEEVMDIPDHIRNSTIESVPHY